MMYNVIHNMQKDERIIFRLGTDLRATLQEYAGRYERSEADVIREALWLFLESKGYRQPPRKKGGKRKK